MLSGWLSGFSRGNDMINIAIIDGRNEEKKTTAKLIEAYSRKYDAQIETDLFDNAEDFIRGFSPFRYSMVFIDAAVSPCGGINLAEKLRRTDRNASLVFIADDHSLMKDSFTVHAFDYIIRPVNSDVIKRILDWFMSAAFNREGFLDFKYEGKEHSLRYSNIVSVVSQDHYLLITDVDENTYRTRMTFSSTKKDLLKDKRFLVVNRGILINMDIVVGFEGNSVQLKNSKNYPVNVRRKKTIENTLNNYILTKDRKKT